MAWVGAGISPRYVERYLANPHQVKPGAKMPDLISSLPPAERLTAARELTHYLVLLGEKKGASSSPKPLKRGAAERGGELFETVGCVACHSPRDADDNETRADDSVPLSTVPNKYSLNSLVAFLKDPHQSRPSGRMPNMKLLHWEAVDVASYLLESSNESDSSPDRFDLDRQLAEKGRARFGELGCRQCHKTDETEASREYSRLTSARSDRGCLSKTTGAWPSYQLSDSQRSAIRAAIDRANTQLTSRQQIAVTLTTFKCVACHQRGELGGVSAERNEYFHTTNPNLGPQGRIPPPLTGVGAKLNPKWTRQVLVSGRSIRPYMLTRMPQYGAGNVAHLVELFSAVDRLPPVTHSKVGDQKELRKTGHQLAGTGGLNCIACHNFQQKPAATMPGVDLTEMSERLRKDWFYHYMRQPQQLSPGTVMPSFWPGGRAIRSDILDGDPDRQLESLWQYLLDGRQARAPRGLIRKPIELLAMNEAVMLRRSYPEIGKRGIGVGYPGGVNLAFDAEQMRIALMWKGKFADPAGVWRSQGHGRVRPLGSDLIRFAAGPEFDSVETPWTVDEGRPPRHRFKGYTLDELRRPTFMYRFDNIKVEDYPIDVQSSETGSSLLRRTLTFSSEHSRSDVAFRAATDANIKELAGDAFLIGKALQIRIRKPHIGEIGETPAGRQLRVPLKVGQKKTTLVLEYTW